jgi:hypothetical protein
MPVHRTLGGWKYGSKGKTYKSKAKAEKQARAIRASEAKQGKKIK